MVDVDAPPVPFDSMGFDPRLEPAFTQLGFEGTRPVQGAVIPIALEGHDVVACAETGTGKTLAFAAPIIERLLSETPGYGDPAREHYTRALILAPTRELAVQIEDSIVGLTYHTPVTRRAVFGGVEMGPQERALKAGVDIVVATPGRLMDHMRHSDTDFVRRAVAGARRSRSHDGHGLLARSTSPAAGPARRVAGPCSPGPRPGSRR